MTERAWTEEEERDVRARWEHITTESAWPPLAGMLRRAFATLDAVRASVAQQLVQLGDENVRLERVIVEQQMAMKRLETKLDRLTEDYRERGEVNARLNKRAARMEQAEARVAEVEELLNTKDIALEAARQYEESLVAQIDAAEGRAAGWKSAAENDRRQYVAIDAQLAAALTMLTGAQRECRSRDREVVDLRIELREQKDRTTTVEGPMTEREALDEQVETMWQVLAERLDLDSRHCGWFKQWMAQVLTAAPCARCAAVGETLAETDAVIAGHWDGHRADGSKWVLEDQARSVREAITRHRARAALATPAHEGTREAAMVKKWAGTAEASLAVIEAAGYTHANAHARVVSGCVDCGSHQAVERAQIWINRQAYSVTRVSMYGHELRSMYPIPSTHDLWLIRPGSDDVLVTDRMTVWLVDEGTRIFSAPKLINASAALARPAPQLSVEGEPSDKTLRSLDDFLAATLTEFDAEATARDLVSRLPALQVALGKLRMAQKISRHLLDREVTG